MKSTTFEQVQGAMTRSSDSPISPIEDILEDARQGRPYILVDAEDRENEGDVVIPAQFATPETVNFMAKHARGLVCLAITAERAKQLRLPPMAAENGTRMGTAFTVSIEAREGVTTGISAHDRAHTITVDGVSLTVNEVEGDVFGVNLIPITRTSTTLGDLRSGDRVNLEIDLLARYAARWRETA